MLIPGVLLKWLLRWQERFGWGDTAALESPITFLLQLRNGISAWLCLAAGAARAVQTPLAEPPLLLLHISMENVSYGYTAKHSKHTQQLLCHP